MSLRLHVGCFSLFPWGRERESHRILSDRFSVSLPISLITKPSPFLVAKPERNFFRLLTGRCTLRWKCLTVALKAVIPQRTRAQGSFMNVISYLCIRCSKLISIEQVMIGS